jgi:hypothetical protein
MFRVLELRCQETFVVVDQEGKMYSAILSPCGEYEQNGG